MYKRQIHHGRTGVTDHAEVVPDRLPEVDRMVDRPPVEFAVATVDTDRSAESIDLGGGYPFGAGSPQGLGTSCCTSGSRNCVCWGHIR